MRAVKLLLFTLLITACSQGKKPSSETLLIVYRYDPPAFIEFSEDLQPVRGIPFAIPLSCGLFNTYPAPLGEFLLIELNCPNGQTVLFLDGSTGSVTQPITDTDAHFLAWTSDGKAIYLKVDSLGSPRTLRVSPDGSRKNIPITEFTYDLSAKPGSDDFTFSFSRGLGQGSELWLAQRDGKVIRQLFADPLNYISFARWSPDGSQIAFIKTPDSQTPFTVGELWVIPSTSEGTDNALPSGFLANVDAGHGYEANWSPDGNRIAFVVRENPEDENADRLSESLISNIYVVNVQSGEITPVTHLITGRAESPFWSPDGNTLAFNMVVDGRMEVQIADMLTGEIRSLITESACCPAWMRK